MQRQMRLNNFTLKRVHSKIGEIITWDVISIDGHSRYATIAQKNSEWLTKRVGWQQFSIKYWIAHHYYPQVVFTAPTRKALLTMIELMHPLGWTKANEEQAEGRFNRKSE